MIDYPKKLNILFDKLNKNSIKPIIVGGYVRDKLLKIDSKDIDIEVYNISSFKKLEDILKEFGSVNSVGKSFGVCKLQMGNLELDFSLPRSDSKIDSGHRGFEVSINPNLDFKTAASRRDFTINSIGYDVLERKILDPFNGISDLKSKKLKAVDRCKFIEDPLRVLRAAQFCARFDLKIDEELFELCKNMVDNNKLEELPKERVFTELKKIILKSKRPSIGFKLLKDFGTDFYTDNMYVLDEISKQLTSDSKTNTVLMLSGLCYNYSGIQASQFILNISDEKELLKRVMPLIENHNEIDKIYLEGISNYALYKLATKVNIEELLILSSSIYLSRDSCGVYIAGSEIRQKAKKLNILNRKLPPILGGKDLLKYGVEPGVKYSEILHLAYETQMSEEFSSHEEALIWLKKYLLL